MHILISNIWMMTWRANVDTAIVLKVMYVLSIDIFIFDWPILKVKSRSLTFRLRISRWWWKTGQKLPLSSYWESSSVGVFTYELDPSYWLSSKGQLHYNLKYFVNGDGYGEYYSCHHTYSRASAFDWHIFIRHCTIQEVKVKVTHNTVGNIS